eukprot:CAMPEP_0170164286 /NCGR_PEP_ID=MMETSP0033_2-20121228/78028_1 /TAXON_ID=195969 /ORGANISM="Dolichomastix tenuilepis, Strain CCMP3274" /LENGTH=978 /DNA_ID=CAMNT_0010401929 /DNA_START=87 /DNA_END=3023 /DNA_ORIENTATION=-
MERGRGGGGGSGGGSGGSKAAATATVPGTPAPDGVLSVTPDSPVDSEWRAKRGPLDFDDAGLWVDEEAAESPTSLYGKFTWKIESFSEISKRELRSNIFTIGDYKWYILVYPQGCDVCNHLSLFLCVADYDKLLPGWSHFAQFTIAVVNKDPKKSKYSDTLHRFCKKEHDWGWKKFMELSKVLDGFTVADTLVIKAQVQVIREHTTHPFRCLDAQYRRELLRVYLTNVEGICRRFLEEKRERLAKLCEDAASFRLFWNSISGPVRDKLVQERADAIMKGVVKRFFNEKEVTSTLVMDALYSGCRGLDVGKAELPGSSSSSSGASVALSVLRNKCCLQGDALATLERVVSGQLDNWDEKEIGDDYCRDAVERDEWRLAELGRRTVEMYVIVHLFLNRVEVAYREALAVQRQEALIREEEEAEVAAAISEGQKRSKKQRAKQRKRERKEAAAIAASAAGEAAAADDKGDDDDEDEEDEGKKSEGDKEEASGSAGSSSFSKAASAAAPAAASASESTEDEEKGEDDEEEKASGPDSAPPSPSLPAPRGSNRGGGGGGSSAAAAETTKSSSSSAAEPPSSPVTSAASAASAAIDAAEFEQLRRERNTLQRRVDSLESKLSSKDSEVSKLSSELHQAQAKMQQMQQALWQVERERDSAVKAAQAAQAAAAAATSASESAHNNSGNNNQQQQQRGAPPAPLHRNQSGPAAVGSWEDRDGSASSNGGKGGKGGKAMDKGMPQPSVGRREQQRQEAAAAAKQQQLEREQAQREAQAAAAAAAAAAQQQREQAQQQREQAQQQAQQQQREAAAAAAQRERVEGAPVGVTAAQGDLLSRVGTPPPPGGLPGMRAAGPGPAPGEPPSYRNAAVGGLVEAPVGVMPNSQRGPATGLPPHLRGDPHHGLPGSYAAPHSGHGELPNSGPMGRGLPHAVGLPPSPPHKTPPQQQPRPRPPLGAPGMQPPTDSPGMESFAHLGMINSLLDEDFL